MSERADFDVIVVGAGPTGLTLALLLATRGVSVLVAEKEAGPYPLPRAAHIDHEIVRVFQELGLAEAVLGRSRQVARYDFVNAERQVLMRLDGTDRIASGGWPAGNMIHQPSIEQALRHAVASSPAISLRDSWAFVELEQRNDGVAASFATSDGQKIATARWLVGCDGARSPVREALGVALDDLGFDEPWMVIDTIVTDPSRLPAINLQICDPARPTTCVVMGEGRHRWEFMLKPGETPEDLLDDARIAELLHPWNVDGAVELERKTVYRFNALVAERWRDGRALLAGDAAHRMPPFAGQGLCSGVRDAANLAWKLAANVRDAAPDALLDSYQPEREPNVRSIIAMAMMMGRTVCITDPAAAAERDVAMIAARKSGSALDRPPQYAPIATGCIVVGSEQAGRYFPQPIAPTGTRLDDVLGSGPWLISRQPARCESASIRTVSLVDGEMAPFAAPLARWFDGHTAEAVLIRPDRYVFGTGAADALVRSWEKATMPAAEGEYQYQLARR